MRKKFIFAVFSLFTIAFTTKGQIPKDTWREHLPFNNATRVAMAENRIYCATEYAVFYYNRLDNSVNKYTKINKLSDLGVGSIGYHQETQTLFIGYKNGNIDLIIDDVKYNFPDIKNKNMITDKRIYHISFNENMAYLSTGFGVVLFDMKNREFSDTYIIGDGGNYLKVNASYLYNDTIFALTDQGILKGDYSNPFLANYKNWVKDTNTVGDYSVFHTGAVFNNELFVVSKNNNNDSCIISSNDNGTWRFQSDTLLKVKSLSTANNQLIVASRWHVDAFDSDYKRTRHFSATDVQHALIDNNNELWFADAEEGLVHSQKTWYKEEIYPSGPSSNEAFAIKYNSGDMLVAKGGYKQTGVPLSKSADVFHFKDEQWINLRKQNENIKPLREVTCMATTSDKDHYFVGTWGSGFFEVKDNIVTLFDSASTNGVFTNYPERNTVNGYIGGMTFDDNGNLWMVRRNHPKPFVVKTPENKWYAYDYNGAMSNKAIGKMIQTRNNDFWTISFKGDGIFVWNDMGTPENGEDDEYKWFRLYNDAGKLINGELHDIVQDVEGAIWIATSDGVGVYDYPSSVLNGGDFYARRPQIVQEGFLKPLLEGQKVTSIAVDGANRKWLGTESGGLFLVSPDGTEQLMIFNVDNSPLFSNTIMSLELNDKTGELFIGTNGGLMSYMTTSSGNKQSFSSVYTFPNPVPPGYNGFITVRGLVYETDVKITDLSGNVVYETISNGGDAIWNGKDLEGNTVSSGIYLVLLANQDGTEREVSKILFMK